MARLTMIECPTRDAQASARFLHAVFGWPHVDFGREYTDVQLGGEQSIGFQQDAQEAPAAPLPVFEVGDLDGARHAVEAAGGVVTVPAFDFPGGRRFHFREPGGNEFAAWTPTS